MISLYNIQLAALEERHWGGRDRLTELSMNSNNFYGESGVSNVGIMQYAYLSVSNSSVLFIVNRTKSTRKLYSKNNNKFTPILWEKYDIKSILQLIIIFYKLQIV
ncbi:hypothetical protein QTP88_014767 [Uroleucon formosanum]